MKPSWWTGLTPLDETIPCGAGGHRLRWADGELRTPDHADPDGERTLAALGGARSPCISILDAWQRHRADLDVLLLASRGSVDRLSRHLSSGHAVQGGWTHGIAPAMAAPPTAAPPVPAVQAVGGGFVGAGAPRARFYYGSGGPAPGPEDPEETLRTLLGLPGTLPDRLVATVIATWARRIDDGDPRVTEALPALHAALYGRALAAVRGWLGGGAVLAIRLADAPAVARRPDGLVGIELPFRWLRDVWARGLTTIAGRFCLTAEPGRSGDWTFTTVTSEFGEPQRLTLRAA